LEGDQSVTIAIWGAFGEEWALDEKVSFDGTRKFITVNSGVTSLSIRDDLYSAWVRYTEREPWASAAMRFSGGDPIPGGETGVTFFLTNGWKLRYDPTVVAVAGVMYSDDYDTAYWSLDGESPVYPATVAALVNSAVSYQNVVTGDLSSVPTVAEIVTQVLAALNATTIPVDAKKMNGAIIQGTGAQGNPWRGEGVQ
jgi:hypothetical protein